MQNSIWGNKSKYLQDMLILAQTVVMAAAGSKDKVTRWLDETIKGCSGRLVKDNCWPTQILLSEFCCMCPAVVHQVKVFGSILPLLDVHELITWTKAQPRLKSDTKQKIPSFFYMAKNDCYYSDQMWLPKQEANLMEHMPILYNIVITLYRVRFLPDGDEVNT